MTSRFARLAMKYILVTGGVISGVGKGIIASSLGVILKEHGFRVSAIKIDPYINIDAGTFSPYEHGEVFVLDDGGEVDLDLGNYERFMGIRLRRDNNITTGKIYKEVIDKERQGMFLGKTVQVVPHITDAIQQWTERVASVPVDGSEHCPDVCIIELGGTIGDIEGMPFVEAFRQFQFRVNKENFLNVHVSLIPEPRSTGEQKTKPTQNSVRELRGLGLSPDLIICRSETPIEETVKLKISNFCHVAPHQVICVHDVSNIYRVPLLLDNQGVVNCLLDRLQLKSRRSRHPMTDWRQLAETADRALDDVRIALVGKYTKSEDAYTSVIKALRHAAIKANRKLHIDFIDAEYLEESHREENPSKYHEMWGKLSRKAVDGVLVPGGFGERGIEGKLAACNWARTRKVPFLGVCLGMQCATIEFARNVLNLKNANSTEFKSDLPVDRQVVVDMPEHHASKGMGGTMRLGLRTTVFLTDQSKLKKLYNNKWTVDERHRHRYEVNPSVVRMLREHGFHFVGMGPDEGESRFEGESPKDGASLITLAKEGRCEELNQIIDRKLANSGETGHEDPVRMEIFELRDHPYYVGVQFHPEYLSTPLHPSPPYLGLLLAASGQLEEWLAFHSSSSSTESLSESQSCGNLSFCPNCRETISTSQIPSSPYPDLEEGKVVFDLVHEPVSNGH